MTVSTTTTSVTYVGDGATTAFAVPFQFFAQSDLEVIERIVATGAETVKLLTTDYAVAGGNGATGTVTAGAAPGGGTTWTIRRRTSRTQVADYRENDPFPAEAHERALDRLAMIGQEVDKDIAERALLVPRSEQGAADLTLPSSVDRAGKLLLFDGAGRPVAGSGAVPSVGVSGFAQTLLDDADAAAARATLGAATVADVAAAALHYAAGQTGAVTTLTDGVTITIDFAAVANALTVTLGGNRSFAVANLPAAGRRFPFVIEIKQDGTGGRTASWSSAFNFPDGAAPDLSTAPGARDLLAAYADSTGVHAGALQRGVD